jgi:hypothetical protein
VVSCAGKMSTLAHVFRTSEVAAARTVSPGAEGRGGTERNGTERNATERNGTQRNGTERNATQHNTTQVTGRLLGVVAGVEPRRDVVRDLDEVDDAENVLPACVLALVVAKAVGIQALAHVLAGIEI